MAVDDHADEKPPAWLVDTLPELGRLLTEIQHVGRIAVDIESNGMFAYQPCVCTVQLAWKSSAGTRAGTRVAIVDTLACPVSELSCILSSPEVIKVIHDLAFDGRVLHFEQVDLCAVRDTSVAATYLKKPGTGLASLLECELGVCVSKQMQNSDWARRPLSPDSISYLAGDVFHLLDLDALLAREVMEAGIEDEVATETAYRLIDALQTPTEHGPPHLRIRGKDRLNGSGLGVLAAIARIRERWAESRNLPPQRILGDKILLAMASHPPRTMRDLLRFGPTKRLGDEQRSDLLQSILDALEREPMNTHSPTRPPPPKVLAARKELEKRLQCWRRAEAERRGTHEQVVLPTHCLRRIVHAQPRTAEDIAGLPGLGPRRAERYAQRLADLVRQE